MIKIDSRIFNEAISINSKYDQAQELLRNNPRATMFMDNFSNEYGELACKMIINDRKNNSTFCQRYQYALGYHDDMPFMALESLLGKSPVDYLFCNHKVMFISDNSLLKPALEAYFKHLKPNWSFEEAGKHFIFGYFSSDWLSNCPNGNGFYMELPTDVLFTDSFLIGIGGVTGTGVPTNKFLSYLNEPVVARN